MTKFSEPYSPIQLIRATGSECPFCGGIVGAMSDLCLDCGRDPDPMAPWIDATMNSLPYLISIILMVAFFVRICR